MKRCLTFCFFHSAQAAAYEFYTAQKFLLHFEFLKFVFSPLELCSRPSSSLFLLLGRSVRCRNNPAISGGGLSITAFLSSRPDTLIFRTNFIEGEEGETLPQQKNCIGKGGVGSRGLHFSIFLKPTLFWRKGKVA